jgi:hypothetical protein
MHKFRNTINIDIVIYNLQHTSPCIIYISNLVVQYTQDHVSPIYIYNIKILQQKITTSKDDISFFCWTTLEGLLRLLANLLLCLLSGLLLLLTSFLLSFSVDILSKCLVILPSLLKFFLGYRQFLF